MIVTALLAASVLAAEAPPRPAPLRPPFAPVVREATPDDLVAPPPARARDFTKPPPGSREDQALYVGIRDDAGRSTLGLGRVVQATHRIKYGRYYEELDRSERPAEAKRLKDRLDEALVAARKAVPERPGIFQCRHLLVDFEARMDPANRELRSELPAVRREARDCAAQMRTLAGAVVPAADELEATLAAIDAHLGRAAPVPPAGSRTGGPERTAAALEELRR